MRRETGAGLLPVLLLLLATVGTRASLLTPPNILTPPYFNLAEGKDINATATCGEDTSGPELYCQLVGASSDLEGNDTQKIIQGQQCDFCDPNDISKGHPPEYAVDGLETWWQSPPLSRGKKYEEVNLTIDLGQEFHVAYVYVQGANAPRPRIWVLEKSKDYGKTWTPWQYFASSNSECLTYFGIESEQYAPITRDDSVICTTKYSAIVPLTNGEMFIYILNERPSAKHYFNSTTLQEWTKATHVRFRFLKTNNFQGTLMAGRRWDHTVTRRYFYSIKDINIGGRCMCNGHADTCDALDANQPKKLICQCQHNTCGQQCNTCCKGFEQKKWRQSTYSKKFVCEPCNCFGHSDECEYSEEIDEKHLSLDIHGNYEGGGRCLNCRHNTEGTNCNRCKPRFFRPSNKPLNATDVCKPCNCDFFYSTGNCYDSTGQCECKPEYSAPNCDKCSYGFFGFPDCKPCECHPNRTVHYHCEATEGQCPCKLNFAGHYCNICAEEYYDFPNCVACECNPIGSQHSVCDVVSGNCSCKSNYRGRQCDICEDGYYNFPSCTYCDCDSRGTEPGVCNKETGQCLCKKGYGGPRCDQCINGYYGYPNCQLCNCSTSGSASVGCVQNGKCSCLSNFVGKTCNQCAPGYYNYPECIPCNCDTHGSNGISCDLEGKCQCYDNFDGDHCDKCKANFYNFPTCEGCNCDPAGIAGTFQGCGSLPAGELCQCKDRVEGRICNQCKKLFWNLQLSNPDGCEDCRCHVPGVIGSIGECDGKTGECVCKPSVTSRDCSECTDGTYNLRESNLFGCSQCGCDIGGSLSMTCNKINGQCLCRSRIEGRTCNEPMRTHYFPTLHQLQYEAEEGRTPSNLGVRYSFFEELFPGYSWKGYAVFSPLQRKIIHEIDVPKSSFYRVVMRYVNPNNEPIVGTVTITPDSHTEVEQEFKVQFKPKAKPSLVTVAGAQGNLPSVLVMNPGHWTMTITVEEKSLFLDYFVLLPQEYYEATILTQDVSLPCEIGYRGLCRHFAYPSLAPFDSVLGKGGYVEGQNPLNEYLTDEETLNEISEKELPLINNAQPKIYYNLPVSDPGAHVLVITYITPPDALNRTATIIVQTDNGDKGKATLHPCKYTSVCRMVVTEPNGKVAIMNFPNEHVSVTLEEEPETDVAIKSIVAIPAQDWSVDYLNPKSVCVRINGQCIQGSFAEASDAKKIELEQNSNILEVAMTPDGIADTNSKFIYLSAKDALIDVPSKVAHPGEYVFVVQYYQPDHPAFDLDVLVQSGKLNDASAPMAHCPSNAGCRSLVRQLDGNTRFQLTDNFVITFKDKNGKGIWLDYVLVIPAEFYNEDYLKKTQFDQTKEFIKKCGNNHFHIETTEKGFCRDSVFSLTTHYNSGALPCSCDIDGTKSFECEKFGGQCPCKPNIIGRRCSICKTGFYGFPNCRPCDCPSSANCEPETGACICPEHVTGDLCDKCEIGTYGYDMIRGCEECQCNPLGVLNGDLQCDLFLGNCTCKPNVVNRQCDSCKAGHFSFPLCDKCDCDVRGTTKEICDQNSADCLCKENVIGSACDLCKEGTFNLQATNEKGCSQCFCSGKTTRCHSASLYRTHVMDMTSWEVATVNEKNETVNILYTIPQEINDTHIVIDMSTVSNDEIVYLSAPQSYLNKKLTSYGGWLNFTIYYTTETYGQAVPGVDIILQGADNFLMYTAEEQPPSSTNYRTYVQLVESNFETKQNLRATREQIMVVLGDLRGIYIRATYWQPTRTISLSYVTFDTATETYIQNAEQASSVEQCKCPPNYQGLSCEECAKGYYRVPGPYGGYCVKCQCNGHADSCDVKTGICHDCKNGTIGDHCENCEEGYYGNATIGTPSDCLICACPLPIPSNNFATGCRVSDDGSKISCDCKPGYYGARCQSCSAGFFGRPETVNDVCKPCECSGNIDTNEIDSCDSVTGDCLKCLNNTFGEACNLCAPGYFGDAIERKDCKSCYCDKCGMKQCDSSTGTCQCHENVIGDKCDSCAPDHYGFSSCQGCRPCSCAAASESTQCDDEDGKCRCKPGVEGRTCDQCMAGFYKYTPEGCTSCGCTTGYSRGASCNPITGQCECLPNVLGEKCDHCPHRHMLDQRRGCIPCDKCIHDLLDDTDDLKDLLYPVASSFQNVADSYFTNQRLDFINDTLTELAPEVKLLDPSRINFEPLKDEINKLKNKAYSLKRQGENQEETSDRWKTKAEENLEEVNNLERDMNKEIQLVNKIISEVQSLAANNNLSSGTKTENAILEAKDILEKIKQVSFLADRDKATDSANRANILVSLIMEDEEPLGKVENDTKAVVDKMKELTAKIDDMFNITIDADEKANKAEILNFENKKVVDSSTISGIKTGYDQVNEDLNKGQDLNKEANSQYDVALFNFLKLQSDLPIGRPTAEMEMLNNYIEDNEDLLAKAKKIVPEAIAHAQDLHEKSMNLENQFMDTRNLTGVRAASVFQDIALNIREARAFTESAVKAVDNATYMSNGLEDRSTIVEKTSSELLNNARRAVAKTQRDLQPTLENAKNNDMVDITNNNQKNSEKLDLIDTALGMLSPQGPTTIVQEAENNADKAEYAIGDALANHVTGKINTIPDDLKKTKQLRKDISDSIRDLSQVERQLDSVKNVLPDINERLSILDKKQNFTNAGKDNLHNKIEELKQKINAARDIANRIRIGLTIFPNTTLELRNPENLPLQATATKVSLYFRTNRTNGLLLYLGNENGINSRTNNHDFMALTVENGFPVLILDLGSGAQKMSINRLVNDHQWRQLIVDRTGRNIKFILRGEKDGKEEEPYKTEESLPGSHSVFNLDQEKSKLFVGGLPASFQAQDSITSSSFDGEMEELMIGDTFVSFWNFVDGENNNQPAYGRDKLISNQPTGYRFDRDGYAIIGKKSLQLTLSSKSYRVQFKFKTWSNNGVMHLIGGKQFLSLELRDGHVLYQFDMGDGRVVVRTPNKYNDGNWHTVEARRVEKIGILKVDRDSFDNVESDGETSILTTNDYIYFGGYPTAVPNVYQGIMPAGFEGCIDEVFINENIIDLTKSLKAYGVAFGCPSKINTLVSFDAARPGYVKWNSVSMDKDPPSLQLSLKFKTQNQNGLIYHLTHKNGSPASTLSLVNGQLVLESEGAKVETSVSEIKLSNGDWHVITATHSGSILRLDIDDTVEEHIEDAPFPQPIQDGALYVGDLPDYIANDGSHVPFVGCIDHATVNGAIVNFANITEKLNAHLQCYNWDQSIPEEPEPNPAEYPTLPPHILVDPIGDGDNDDLPGGKPDEHPIYRGENIAQPSTRIPETTPTSTTLFLPKEEKTVDGCRLPLEPLPDPDQNAENASRFGLQANSRFQYNTLNGRYKDRSDFQIDIKTSASEGLIFYGSAYEESDFIALYVKDDRVHYTFDCGSGPVTLMSATKVNDHLWHTIYFNRTGKTGQLATGDNAPVTNESPGDETTIDIQSPFFVGGIDPAYNDRVYTTIETNKTFSGCIKNFMLNGQHVGPPAYQHEVKPCSKRIEPGMFFHDGNGSNWFRADDRFTVGRQMEIEMEIKPRSSSGLLLSVHGKNDHVILEMVNGTIKFLVKAAKGQIETSFDAASPNALCDGKWHNIRAVKQKNVVLLSVDHKASTPGIGGKNLGGVGTKHPIYIGGHPNLEAGKALRGTVSRAQYVGCIRDIIIKSKAYPLDPTRIHGRVDADVCPTT